MATVDDVSAGLVLAFFERVVEATMVLGLCP
jgi:hypothetical protein